jgi:hypothetical protein
MKNFVIGIASVGVKYHDKTIKLINDVNNVIDVNFIILTDNPDIFKFSDRITTVKYENDRFSFHDKKILFKEGFKKYEHVILMDADHGLRDVHFLNEITDLDLEPGIYPQVLWKHPADCSFENFISGKSPRMTYGLEFKDFCLESSLLVDDVILFQESFLIIRKDERINRFMEVWDSLADFCNKKDIERNQHVLGYGEGYSIGVAIRNSGLPIHENSQAVHMIVRNFKHFAWER